MSFKVGVGKSDFEALRKSGNYYVDKTDIIYELVEETDNQVTLFGDSFLYCPWDVMNYMSALKKRKDANPKNYWRFTSHNGILLTFVERTDFDVTEKFETLLNGKTITQPISDELTYDMLHASIGQR